MFDHVLAMEYLLSCAVEQLGARRVHGPEVAGSSPAGATAMSLYLHALKIAFRDGGISATTWLGCLAMQRVESNPSKGTVQG